jgi:urea carboxylase
MEFKNIKSVLIANRGEIASRIIKTCKKYNLKSVAIYPIEDIESLHVIEADVAVQLEGIGANAYIDIDQIVKIAIKENVDVVIPGYGFLSENSNFAFKLAEHGIAFAGPSAESIEKFGLKHLARKIAIDCNVPVVPGTELIEDSKKLIQACKKIGYPIILKATAGGGGMGLKVCYSSSEVEANFAEVKSRGASLFSNTGVFVEKYIKNSRHIEVQIFGNGLGDVVSYGERECSIQRRHQKIIEETPSPFVESLGKKEIDLRKRLTVCAKNLASSINYKSAGTVEFLVDDDTGNFYFLEMNTRLQVEHGITELVYNVDLVYFMLLQSDCELSNTGLDVSFLKSNLNYTDDGVEIPNGHAFEVRVYAENPIKDFAPSPGILHHVSFPTNSLNTLDYKIRIDHWIETGGKVSPYFDPLLAKVMVWSPTRTSANIIKVLNDIKIQGPINNIEYCISILNSEFFKKGYTLTNFLDTFKFEPYLIEFEEAGNYTTVQDLPGRPEIRHGVPRSGPVDDLSLQLANIIVENDINTEGLEFTMKGPVLKFHSSAIIAFAGATFNITLNDSINLPMFTQLFIPAGSIINVDEVVGKSSKCFMAIKGGLPGVANYLGSKSCTPALNLGGHQGRTFLPGDCLAVKACEFIESFKTGYILPDGLKPKFDSDEVIVRMISGPHDTPDIASDVGLEKVYSYPYTVNFNSNRGAIRLDGPAFDFSRSNGGDGGGHPSNILEYPYPCCGLSTVGSTMVLFGVDGATLSGFACLSVPCLVDFRKFGQAATNSIIKFKLISYTDSIKLLKQRLEFLKIAATRPNDIPVDTFVQYDTLKEYQTIESKLGKFLYHREKSTNLPSVSFRQGGESMIIIDFGVTEFSLFNNGRQHIFNIEITKRLKGIYNSVECSTGAMCVTFDPLNIDRDDLLTKLIEIESEIPNVEKLKVPSRLFKLPVCFEHSAIDHCIKRYMHSQRPHAPYLPSNIDYLMKANCIESYDKFKECIIGKPEIVVAVSFLCANPLLVNIDPRSRFLTSKYNPARTSTPQGAIGSGGVSQSIYSVESPGGYMIWGMTLPNWYWDTFSRIHSNPWPLENFDQVVYYEVNEKELSDLNTKFLTKRLNFEPEENEFDFAEYSKFLKSIEAETIIKQDNKKVELAKLADEEEKDQKLWNKEKEEAKASKSSSNDLLNNPNAMKIIATLPANVFKFIFGKNDIVSTADVLVILEAMKMEIPIRINDKKANADSKYRILENIVDEGDVVNPGDIISIVLKL